MRHFCTKWRLSGVQPPHPLYMKHVDLLRQAQRGHGFTFPPLLINQHAEKLQKKITQTHIQLKIDCVS